MTDRFESENPKSRRSSDEQRRRAELLRASFFEDWMKQLSAAYRQEISLATQAMYLQSLSDLPLDRLNLAFERAVRECKFMPTIAELRSFEAAVQVPPERLEAARERLRERIAAQPEVRQLKSALDAPKSPGREIRQLSEAELAARLEDLRKQAGQLK